MSKTNSCQFQGTAGQRIDFGMKPSNQLQQLISWSNKVLDIVGSGSKKRRNRFNTATVAFDEETGNLYFGRNGGIDKFRNTIHPDLVKILPSISQNRYPTTWNCSESDAINRALYGGAKLYNLHIYTIHSSNRGFGDKNLPA